MSSVNKIFLSALAVSYMALTSVCVYGQDAIFNKHKHRPPLTIGFQTGRELLFHSSPLLHSRQSKIHYSLSSSFVLRKPLTRHLKMETGIRYTSVQNNVARIKGLDKKTMLVKGNIAVPFTLQYYFIPERCSRVHAYCGAGLQYNLYTNSNGYPPFTSDINPENKVTSGTKYLSVLITQGITFQINTRIQLSESFHFIPGTDKALGFDLGIGYNIR